MKRKINNRGFSLPELIIVMAIMAVLVGVLLPTYLKYVNNSKVSADLTPMRKNLRALCVRRLRKAGFRREAIPVWAEVHAPSSRMWITGR